MPKVENKTEAVTAPREVPTIKPTQVQIEPHQYHRTVHVRLPAGITAQDLHDWPKDIWKLVQDHKEKALRRFDEVRLIASDESFLIPDAVVTDADDKMCKLDFKRFVQLPSRSETFEDENYKIFFDGADRFVVDRKTDNVRLLRGFANVESAKAEMHKLYPRKVA